MPSNQQRWDEVNNLKFALKKKPHQTFFERHGLTIVTSCILLAWIVLYSVSNEKKHIGSFFGNAIADWSGVVVKLIDDAAYYMDGSPLPGLGISHWRDDPIVAWFDES